MSTYRERLAALQQSWEEEWVDIDPDAILADLMLRGYDAPDDDDPIHLYGTTEGQIKGWITRRAGMSPAALHPDAEERMKALKVPPAWKDVHLSDDPNAPMQAIGTDSKGRTQYRYSAKHTAGAKAEKFARLAEFHGELPKLRSIIETDMNDRTLSEKERESAVMLHIIEQTAFRPGSEADTGGDKKAYGVTTLEGRHVRVVGDKIHFKFIGKEGVLNAKTITNPALARELEERKKVTGPKQQLFPTASDGDMRDYLHSRDGDFKPKDFRTWHGTNAAIKAIKKMKPPKNAKEFKKAQGIVAKVVAAHLGNTPTVAKNSYIDPAVWAPWEAKLTP